MIYLLPLQTSNDAHRWIRSLFVCCFCFVVCVVFRTQRIQGVRFVRVFVCRSIAGLKAQPTRRAVWPSLQSYASPLTAPYVMLV